MCPPAIGAAIMKFAPTLLMSAATAALSGAFGGQKQSRRPDMIARMPTAAPSTKSAGPGASAALDDETIKDKEEVQVAATNKQKQARQRTKLALKTLGAVQGPGGGTPLPPQGINPAGYTG